MNLVRRSRLRIISAILLMIMLILTACQGNNGNQSDNSGNGQNSDSGPNSAVNENPDPVELTIHAWMIPDGVQAVIESFQKNYPWITIKHNGTINAFIINNIIAGEKSDIIFIDHGLSQWISGGNDLLEDLTPYIEQDTTIQSADVANGLWESMKVGDRIYSLPYADIPMWIAVNKDMINKYGIEMPPLDWTYNDMLDIAKEATDLNANDWGMYGIMDWFLNTLPVANGNAKNFRLMGEGNLRSVADTPGVLADLQWLQDLKLMWNVTPTDQQIRENGIKSDTGVAFIGGNILFAAIADWDLPTLQKRAQFEWDILPFPRGTEEQVTSRHIGLMAMTKASENKEAAFTFMSYLFSEEAQKIMIENGMAAWVRSPELDNYYSEVPIWEGKNRDVVLKSAQMGLMSTDATMLNLKEYGESIMARIVQIMNKGGNFSDIIPYVEKYNRNVEATRAEIGF